jgi:hypothetical protein
LSDFKSARELEEPNLLRAFERRVHRINDLQAEIRRSDQRLEDDPAHDHLNELLDEK